MAKDVNVTISDIQPLGTNAPVARYSFDLELEWTDNEGVVHEHSGTYTWPNFLAGITNKELKSIAHFLALLKVKKELGIIEEIDI